MRRRLRFAPRIAVLVALVAVAALAGGATGVALEWEAGSRGANSIVEPVTAVSTPSEAVLGATSDAERAAPAVAVQTTDPGATAAAPDPTRTPLPLGEVARPRSAIRTVALGDSLTAWPSGNPWPSRLAAADPALALVRNAGVPGNTTAQMLARFDMDVTRYSPQLLFVLGGTNDIGHGIPQATTIANLRAIVRAGLTGGATVVLLTIPPDAWPGEVAAVRSLNAEIEALGADEGVPVVNIYTPLATPAGVYQPQYTIDGLHFTDAGAQVVADTVREALGGLGL